MRNALGRRASVLGLVRGTPTDENREMVYLDKENQAPKRMLSESGRRRSISVVSQFRNNRPKKNRKMNNKRVSFGTATVREFMKDKAASEYADESGVSDKHHSLNTFSVLAPIQESQPPIKPSIMKPSPHNSTSQPRVQQQGSQSAPAEVAAEEGVLTVATDLAEISMEETQSISYLTENQVNTEEAGMEETANIGNIIQQNLAPIVEERVEQASAAVESEVSMELTQGVTDALNQTSDTMEMTQSLGAILATQPSAWPSPASEEDGTGGTDLTELTMEQTTSLPAETIQQPSKDEETPSMAEVSMEETQVVDAMATGTLVETVETKSTDEAQPNTEDVDMVPTMNVGAILESNADAEPRSEDELNLDEVTMEQTQQIPPPPAVTDSEDAIKEVQQSNQSEEVQDEEFNMDEINMSQTGNFGKLLATAANTDEIDMQQTGSFGALLNSLAEEKGEQKGKEEPQHTQEDGMEMTQNFSNILAMRKDAQEASTGSTDKAADTSIAVDSSLMMDTNREDGTLTLKLKKKWNDVVFGDEDPEPTPLRARASELTMDMANLFEKLLNHTDSAGLGAKTTEIDREVQRRLNELSDKTPLPPAVPDDSTNEISMSESMEMDTSAEVDTSLPTDAEGTSTSELGKRVFEELQNSSMAESPKNQTSSTKRQRVSQEGLDTSTVATPAPTQQKQGEFPSPATPAPALSPASLSMINESLSLVSPGGFNSLNEAKLAGGPGLEEFVQQTTLESVMLRSPSNVPKRRDSSLGTFSQSGSKKSGLGLSEEEHMQETVENTAIEQLEIQDYTEGCLELVNFSDDMQESVRNMLGWMRQYYYKSAVYRQFVNCRNEDDKRQYLENIKNEQKLAKLNAKLSWNNWRKDLLSQAKHRLVGQLDQFKNDLVKVQEMEETLVKLSDYVTKTNDAKLIRMRDNIEEHVNVISEFAIEKEQLTERMKALESQLAEVQGREEKLEAKKKSLAFRTKARLNMERNAYGTQTLLQTAKISMGFKDVRLLQDAQGGTFEALPSDIPGMKLSASWNKNLNLQDLAVSWCTLPNDSTFDQIQDSKLAKRLFGSSAFQRMLIKSRGGDKLDSLSQLNLHIGRMGDLMRDVAAVRQMSHVNLIPIATDDSPSSNPAFYLNVNNYSKGYQMRLRVTLTTEYPFASIIDSTQPISLLQVPEHVNEEEVMTVVEGCIGFGYLPNVAKQLRALLH